MNGGNWSCLLLSTFNCFLPQSQRWKKTIVSTVVTHFGLCQHRYAKIDEDQQLGNLLRCRHLPKILVLDAFMFFFYIFKVWSLSQFPPFIACLCIALACLALPCIALHWLALHCIGLPAARNSVSSVICSVSERERKREEGETFVCKTCRGRSIHPFQKNNITFKWRNSLELPNPIFEPRSLSRTFPFWIFHSQQLWSGGGRHLIGDYPPSILSGAGCKNYPDHLAPRCTGEKNYSQFFRICLRFQNQW